MIGDPVESHAAIGPACKRKSLYVFALCHHQLREIFVKMAADRLVVKDLAEKLQCFINNRWDIHGRRHAQRY